MSVGVGGGLWVGVGFGDGDNFELFPGREEKVVIMTVPRVAIGDGDAAVPLGEVGSAFGALLKDDCEPGADPRSESLGPAQRLFVSVFAQPHAPRSTANVRRQLRPRSR